MLQFTRLPVRGVFCECSVAKVTENPRASVFKSREKCHGIIKRSLCKDGKNKWRDL